MTCVLRGRVALVTGSSRGVGRAIATELARAGADVAVHCRESVEEGLAVVRAIEELGRRSVLVLGDTRVAGDVDRFTAQAVDTLGAIDILVNNAVYALLKPFLEISPEEWREQLDYKSLAYYLTTRQVLPIMLQAGRGVIINVLSTVGVRGGEGEAGYAVTNGGAMALTRAIANEFGTRGVRCCGVMVTWADNAFDPGDPECVRWLERFALGRVTRLEEVARTVAFLASDAAGGITGSFVSVDAGYLSKA
ncbi:MAG: SDR family oxidoreductase [bacterium]|nr:SDR family oxidoreductase [bacterium]